MIKDEVRVQDSLTTGYRYYQSQTDGVTDTVPSSGSRDSLGSDLGAVAGHVRVWART